MRSVTTHHRPAPLLLLLLLLLVTHLATSSLASPVPSLHVPPSGAPSSPLLPGIDVPARSVVYTLNVSYATGRPDGRPRRYVAVNGRLPGPAVRANLGDTIVVRTVNSFTPDSDVLVAEKRFPARPRLAGTVRHGEMGVDYTTMHFHGVQMLGTYYMDGVPMVTQCPIASGGGQFEHRFQATQPGTYWYHAHYPGQRGDGQFGAVVVDDPDDPYEDLYSDEFVLVVSDWFGVNSNTLFNRSFSRRQGMVPFDSALANGRWWRACALNPTTTTCDPAHAEAGQFEAFHVEPGSTVRFRIICASAIMPFEIGLDGNLAMQVIAADGRSIEAQSTHVVSLASGETVDVLVTFPASPAERIWWRMSSPDYTMGGHKQRGLAMIVTSKDAFTTPATPDDITTLVQELAHVPDPSKSPLAAFEVLDARQHESVREDREFLRGVHKVDHMVRLNISRRSNAVYYINGERFHHTMKPVYLLPPEKQGSVIRIDLGTVLLLELVNWNMMNHPVHIHGHHFRVVKEVYNSLSVDELVGQLDEVLESASPLKHTVVVKPFSTTRLLMAMDNPGYWFAHCHITLHHRAGYAWMFQVKDAADKTGATLLPPASVPQPCVESEGNGDTPRDPNTPAPASMTDTWRAVVVVVVIFFALLLLYVVVSRMCDKRPVHAYGVASSFDVQEMQELHPTGRAQIETWTLSSESDDDAL